MGDLALGFVLDSCFIFILNINLPYAVFLFYVRFVYMYVSMTYLPGVYEGQKRAWNPLGPE